MRTIIKRTLNWVSNPIVYFAIAVGIVLVSLKQVEFAILSGRSSGLHMAAVLAFIFTLLGFIFYLFNKSAPKEEDYTSDEIPELSSRELEILVLISNGLSNADIGNKLFISLPTVKSHVASIFEKLRVSNRSKAIIQARRMGILQENEQNH